MLASKFRLKKTHEIEYILKRGKFYRTNIFLVKYRPNQEGHHRFTIITSQKFAKKAVPRNRVRRQMYEAIRLNLPKNTAKTHYDCIIIPTKQIFDIDYQIINKNVCTFLKNL